MKSFHRSVAILKASMHVVRKEKELIVLTFMGMLGALAISIPFFLALVAFGSGETTDASGDQVTTMTPVGYVIVIVMGISAAYVGMLFRGSVMVGANSHFDTGECTLVSAWSGAIKRSGPLFVWTLITYTVSMILRAIRNRGGLAGVLLAGLLDVAWAVITVFVLPIVLFENVGVVEAIKRSKALLGRTWGVNLIGQGGLGILSLLFLLPGGLVMAGGVFLLISDVFVAGLGTLGLGLLLLVVAGLFLSTLTAVFQVALYRFANGNSVGDMDATLLETSFSKKAI